MAQEGPSEGSFMPYLSTQEALRGATFGLPSESFWVYADKEQRQTLLELMNMIEEAGATIVIGTEILDREQRDLPSARDWDFGTTRGFPTESEFTIIKTDFYRNIGTYLSELFNSNIRNLEDIVAFNYANDGSGGGNPWPFGIPAFYSGQDSFLASLETKGEYTEEYWQALHFTQSTTHKGIDSALGLLDGSGPDLNGLLVPPVVGQTYQIAGQAGYPMITLLAGVHAATGMPFGLAVMQTK
jgi:amidase